MIDVSFFLPGIRTHFWENFYFAAKKACTRHSFEIVVVSPFDAPSSLKGIDEFRVINDWGNPTRCAQIAAAASCGRLLYHTVDDGIFFPNSVDATIDQYDKSCFEGDMINMRYREGPNFSGNQLPLDFWTAWSSDDLRLPGVNPLWKTSLHFLINRNRFLTMGGFDSQFEYLNHPLHDFAFRLQASGGKIIHSCVEVINCTHFPNETVDHGPIHNAQIYHDTPIFNEIYMNPNAAFERISIPFDNWIDSPAIWARRFGGKKMLSYSELGVK